MKKFTLLTILILFFPWFSFAQVVTGGGNGVTSFNTRTGAVTLTSGDVTSALTYVPVNPAAAAIVGGTIDGTSLGGTSPSSAAFTTLSTSSTATLPIVNLGTTGSFANWTTVSPIINVLASTLTDNTGSGAISARSAYSIGVPTLAAGTAETITNPTTLVIGMPVAGSNVNFSGTVSSLTLLGSLYFPNSSSINAAVSSSVITFGHWQMAGGSAFALPTPATLSSGFASGGTADVISHTNGTLAWTDTVGTGTIASTATFTMPAAIYGWAGCRAYDQTTSSIVLQQTGVASMTSVTFTSYGITTGLAIPPTAGDVIQIGGCIGH